MEVDDLLDVRQPKSKPLDVVYITSMNAVEFIKDLLDILFLDALTGIANGKVEVLVIIPCLDIDVKRFFWLTVFHCVVHQVCNGILEMRLIHIDGRIDSLDIRIDLAPSVLYPQA